MLITDIQGKDVILSKGSITVKDDNNKTCGVVRNLRKFKDIQANKQFTLRKQLNGVWGVNRFGISMDRVYFDLSDKAYIIRTPLSRFVIDSERQAAEELWDKVEMQVIEVNHIN